MGTIGHLPSRQAVARKTNAASPVGNGAVFSSYIKLELIDTGGARDPMNRVGRAEQLHGPSWAFAANEFADFVQLVGQ